MERITEILSMDDADEIIFALFDYVIECKYPVKTAHSLLEIFWHTDYVP
ncbi:Uncharacterised protein [Pragia fontium]|nr:Uncharacterised protein [Pragia fontium]